MQIVRFLYFYGVQFSSCVFLRKAPCPDANRFKRVFCTICAVPVPTHPAFFFLRNASGALPPKGRPSDAALSPAQRLALFPDKDLYREKGRSFLPDCSPLPAGICEISAVPPALFEKSSLRKPEQERENKSIREIVQDKLKKSAFTY